METILIVVLLCAFVFFIYSFHNMSKKSIKKDAKKEDVKPEESKKSDKEDIPDILKEVTVGNYMYDLSHVSEEEPQFVENENISLDEQNEVKRTNVEKVFDDIDDIGNDFDEDIDIEVEEINDVEDDLNQEIIEAYDDEVLLGDVAGSSNSNKKSSNNEIVDEYARLSKKMKAIIISNALDKKHHD